jgi:hypothetical protein
MRHKKATLPGRASCLQSGAIITSIVSEEDGRNRKKTGALSSVSLAVWPPVWQNRAQCYRALSHFQTLSVSRKDPIDHENVQVRLFLAQKRPRQGFSLSPAASARALHPFSRTLKKCASFSAW